MRSADILAQLMGSANRVKLIRLFLLNPDRIFSLPDIYRRAKMSKSAGHREISLLKKIGFVKAGSEFVEIKSKKRSTRGKQAKPKKKRIHGWKLNESFSLMLGLKGFILETAPLSKDQLLKRLQRAGRIKLVILSGIFGDENSSRVDILVVGDSIRKGVLERAIHDIEAEVGKELTYAAFNTGDFIYRLGMYDKFIRDILDYSHEKLLDKIGI
jgi:hypothetical protein